VHCGKEQIDEDKVDNVHERGEKIVASRGSDRHRCDTEQEQIIKDFHHVGRNTLDMSEQFFMRTPKYAYYGEA